MPILELYLFKVRDSITGRWQQTRYPMTVEMARARFREGNYELLESSREVRDSDSAGSSTARPQHTPAR